MKFFVNGGIKSPEQAKIRTFNFGQHWRTMGVKDLVFELWLEPQVLDMYYSGRWMSLLHDARTDTEDDYELFQELARCNFLPLNHFLENIHLHIRLLELLMEADGHDMLLTHIGGSQRSPDIWVINSIDSLRIESNYIVYSGNCRYGLDAWAYQDF